MTGRPACISVLDVVSNHQKGFRTGVSLHCHSRHSNEGLNSVPQYASKIPVVSSFFKREKERYYRLQGKALDLTKGYWTPPVTLKCLLDSEIKRIEHQLGLQALVSVTDHDNLSTGRFLQRLDASDSAPISLEWTVPIDSRAYHLGVHNLPPESSAQIVNELRCYTRKPQDGRLLQLLAWLNDYPETLLVLNHPFSGLDSHCIRRLKAWLTGLLNHYPEAIHAMEINGYRSWSENRRTVALAEKLGLPVISGGDRHGCSPNALLNLTNAASFSEFVSEIRHDKVSEILVMPEYRENLFVRKVESVADFFRYYPEYPPGQRRWTNRVFFYLEEGVVRPLSYYWYRTVPLWVKSFMWLVSLTGSKYLKSALQICFRRKEEVTLQNLPDSAS